MERGMTACQADGQGHDILVAPVWVSCLGLIIVWGIWGQRKEEGKKEHLSVRVSYKVVNFGVTFETTS